MASNPHCARLSGWSVLEVVGPDAGAFLQRQSMNDLARLDRDGRWQWNGLLNAKGRVLALFVLLRRNSDAYWLLLPDASAEVVAGHLRGFVFRSKLELKSRPELAGYGEFGPCAASAETIEPDPAAPGEIMARLDLGLVDTPRHLLIAVAGRTAVDPEADARWHVADLRGGLPRTPDDALSGYTPQMLGLHRLAAFSLKKGCYPGQEIVARTHYLGQAKRGLTLLEAERPLQRGTAVLDAQGTRLADLLATASHRERHVALAVLPQEATNEPYRTGTGHKLARVAFVDWSAISPA